MKKSLITLAVMLTAAALVAVFCGPAAAKVSGVCGDCHTMHNSQDGDPTATEGPYTALLMDDCVGCHSSNDSSPTKTIGVSTVPVVYNLSEPNYNPGTLAGGNFYWVADSGGNDDAKGHNVLGISDEDKSFKDPLPHAYAPGGFSCGGNSCHDSLAKKQNVIPEFGSGCQGCHLRPAHHADDSATVIGAASPSTDGYYRFLSGHATSGDHGVCGIEDSDWQASTGHNEYLGVSGKNESGGPIYGAFLALGNTMTAFCCGCHGNFHVEQQCSDGECKWIRHPSDAVIPDTGEYADAFGAGGTGTGIYNALVPVARPSLSAVSTTVAIGTDMVMCLSCHRPHGSPNDDLLRWDYNAMNAGNGGAYTGKGCFACHTRKDDRP